MRNPGYCAPIVFVEFWSNSMTVHRTQWLAHGFRLSPRPAWLVLAFVISGVAFCTRITQANAAVDQPMLISPAVPATGVPLGVMITGPISGTTSMLATFTATISPVTTTVLITYVWQLSDMSAVTHTATLTDVLRSLV